MRLDTASRVPKMPPELLALFDRAELAKYLTDEELAEYDAAVDARLHC